MTKFAEFFDCLRNEPGWKCGCTDVSSVQDVLDKYSIDNVSLCAALCEITIPENVSIRIAVPGGNTLAKYIRYLEYGERHEILCIVIQNLKNVDVAGLKDNIKNVLQKRNLSEFIVVRDFTAMNSELNYLAEKLEREHGISFCSDGVGPVYIDSSISECFSRCFFVHKDPNAGACVRFRFYSESTSIAEQDGKTYQIATPRCLLEYANKTSCAGHTGDFLFTLYTEIMEEIEKQQGIKL